MDQGREELCSSPTKALTSSRVLKSNLLGLKNINGSSSLAMTASNKLNNLSKDSGAKKEVLSTNVNVQTSKLPTSVRKNSCSATNRSFSETRALATSGVQIFVPKKSPPKFTRMSSPKQEHTKSEQPSLDEPVSNDSRSTVSPSKMMDASSDNDILKATVTCEGEERVSPSKKNQPKIMQNEDEMQHNKQEILHNKRSSSSLVEVSSEISQSLSASTSVCVNSIATIEYEDHQEEEHSCAQPAVVASTSDCQMEGATEVEGFLFKSSLDESLNQDSRSANNRKANTSTMSVTTKSMNSQLASISARPLYTASSANANKRKSINTNFSNSTSSSSLQNVHLSSSRMSTSKITNPNLNHVQLSSRQSSSEVLSSTKPMLNLHVANQSQTQQHIQGHQQVLVASTACVTSTHAVPQSANENASAVPLNVPPLQLNYIENRNTAYHSSLVGTHNMYPFASSADNDEEDAKLEQCLESEIRRLYLTLSQVRARRQQRRDISALLGSASVLSSNTSNSSNLNSNQHLFPSNSIGIPHTIPSNSNGLVSPHTLLLNATVSNDFDKTGPSTFAGHSTDGASQDIDNEVHHQQHQLSKGAHENLLMQKESAMISAGLSEGLVSSNGTTRLKKRN
eukprot:GDKJ01004943.1.p1 GENE.GDKJ01004943.1~~GDKJ01004943.1.p1  ORF type:complete len:639 (+),score=152.19 GDKJ01004943.1:45-1919(+)